MNLLNRSNVLRSFSSVVEITAYLFRKFCLGFKYIKFSTGNFPKFTAI